MKRTPVANRSSPPVTRNRRNMEATLENVRNLSLGATAREISPGNESESFLGTRLAENTGAIPKIPLTTSNLTSTSPKIMTDPAPSGTPVSSLAQVTTSKDNAEATTTAAVPPQPTTEEQKEKKPNVLETHGYFLGRTIGTGSYAIVRLAHSERHKCSVAVKIISKYTAPAEYMKHFLPREIEVVKGLRHPNLIRFLQAIETTHRMYLVMEYAENGSLLDLIRKERLIDEVKARKWFRQLVEGVEYCHERGVVHRDIKCENLLFDTDWTIKLSDFGFARSDLRARNGQLILSETYCGSYAYASPEILRGIPYQPYFADIWSMGVVLYAMVFGRLPFDDSNYTTLIKQVTNKVVFPKEPKVSSNCRSLISQILAPLKSRIRLAGIRRDPWFTTGTETDAGPSGEKKSISIASSTEEEDKAKRRSSDAKDVVVAPPELITKEQLEKGARPKDKRRRSTLEEDTLRTQEPEESDSDEAQTKSAPKKDVKK